MYKGIVNLLIHHRSFVKKMPHGASCLAFSSEAGYAIRSSKIVSISSRRNGTLNISPPNPFRFETTI